MKHYIKTGFLNFLLLQASSSCLFLFTLGANACMIAPPMGWHAIIIHLLRLLTSLGVTWLVDILMPCIPYWYTVLTAFGHCPMAFALFLVPSFASRDDNLPFLMRFGFLV